MSNEQKWLNLSGKVVVITGAAGGMGSFFAEAFAKQNAQLALIDIKQEKVVELAERLSTEYATKVIALSCDTSKEAAVDETVQKVVAEFARVDVLVNTAAILRPAMFESLSLEEWETTLKINLTGYFLMSQRFGKVMIQQRKGIMIHISTLLSEFPETYSGAYSVSKAGVNMLSKQMAAEWGQYGIRSNCVLPSLVRTPLSNDFYANKDVLEKREAITANKRIGTIADISNTVLFLASDRSDYINGSEVKVEGGLGIMMGDQIAKPGGRKEYALKHL